MQCLNIGSAAVECWWLVRVQREEFMSFWQQYKHCPLTGRNQILASVCPQVYGLYVVKLAVALVLVGGVQVKLISSYLPFISASVYTKTRSKVNSSC